MGAGAARWGRQPFPGPQRGGGQVCPRRAGPRGAALPSTGPSRGAGEATGCVTAQATFHSRAVNPESRDFYEAGGGHWSGATSGGRERAGVSAEICVNVREDPELKPPSLTSPSHPQHWLPEGPREGRAGRSSEPWGARDCGEGAELHPTSPEDKGGISSHLC